MKVATATPCSSGRLLLLLAILAAALLLFSAQPASSAGQSVKYLPGYNGELPFHLQTGYTSVEDSELFYYFIESQGNPLEDPLMLWLSGGPGCSSFVGLIYDIGPMEFDIHNYTGGLPKLRYYADAWTKGIVLGSPRTDNIIDENSKIVFAHRIALISDEIYEKAKEACNGSYSDAAPNNTACHLAISDITKCIRDLFRGHILEPRCLLLAPPQTRSEAIHTERRSLQAQAQEEDEDEDEDEDGSLDVLLSPPRIPDL